MSTLTLEGLSKNYGEVEALVGVDLSVGDGEFFASLVNEKWEVKEASSFKKGLLPSNSILTWDSAETYHKALGVVSDQEKESQKMMEMIQAQMAAMPQQDDSSEPAPPENPEEDKVEKESKEEEQETDISHYWDYLYEPDSKEVIDTLMMRYIESLVYQGVVENIACEQAARMVAMKSASDNAGDLISDLQLVYNKARQAAITQELSEIVAGAAAV